MAQKRPKSNSDGFGRLDKRLKVDLGLLLASDNWTAGLLEFKGSTKGEYDFKMEVSESQEDQKECGEEYDKLDFEHLIDNGILIDYLDSIAQESEGSAVDFPENHINLEEIDINLTSMERFPLVKNDPNTHNIISYLASKFENIEGKFVNYPTRKTNVIDIQVWGPSFNRDEYQYWYRFTQPDLSNIEDFYSWQEFNVESLYHSLSHFISLRNGKIQDMLHELFKREIKEGEGSSRKLIQIELTFDLDPIFPMINFIRGITFKISEGKVIEVSRQ